MMRSLFSGISGLRVHQTRMDVIGNNIANVNTVGFKSSRVTFNEVFNQSLSGASGANPDANRGGINPKQIGLGVGVASIDKIMTTGSAQRTDNPFDLMIQGEGFFIVGDSSGTYFTRAGAFNLDSAGNLVTSSGLMVKGWNADNDGNVTRGVADDITITGEKEYVPPEQTSQIVFNGNLNAANNTAMAKTMSMTFYDTVGNKYVVDVEMQYSKGGLDDNGDPIIDPDTGELIPTGWRVSINPIAYPNGDRTKGVLINIDQDNCAISFSNKSSASIVGLEPVEVGLLNFDTNGQPSRFIPVNATDYPGNPADGVLANPQDSDTYKSDLEFVLRVYPGEVDAATGAILYNDLIPDSTFGKSVILDPADPVNTTLDNAMIINFSGLTQFGSQTSDATSTAKDGHAPGSLNGISIGSDGTIVGRYSNGQTKVLAQIPIAIFKNPAGLEKVGDNLFVPTSNSGEFDGIGQEVMAEGGSILGGVLEMSNVDLSQEFVEMITTQRGFQANSRIISTSDELLQELVNLKR